MFICYLNLLFQRAKECPINTNPESARAITAFTLMIVQNLCPVCGDNDETTIIFDAGAPAVSKTMLLRIMTRNDQEVTAQLVAQETMIRDSLTTLLTVIADGKVCTALCFRADGTLHAAVTQGGK